MRVTIVAVLVGAVLLIMALWLSASHWWRKASDAKVTYNGEVSSTSNLYRSHDGKLLLHLITQEGEEFFVIYPEVKRIGLPNRSSFWTLPGYVYSKNDPPLVVYMDDRTKVENDPQLVVQSTSFEFTTGRGGRVRATW